MTRCFISVTLRVCVLCITVLGVQVSTASDDRFTQLSRRFEGAGKTEDKREILADMQKLAETSSQSPQEKANRLLLIGHKYYQLGDYHKGLNLFRSVSKISGAADVDKVDALRMVGQMSLYVFKNHILAQDAYGEMLDILGTSTDTQVQQMSKGAFMAEGLEKLASACQATGNFDRSTQLRQRLLTEVKISDDRRQIAFLENAHDYFRQGEYQKAVASYDGLLTEYPSFGKKDGRILDIRYDRINSLGYNELDPRRLELLRGLWEDPENANYLQRYNIGRMLVDLLRQAGDEEISVGVGDQLIAELDRKLAGLNSRDVKRFGLDNAYSQTVVNLAEIAFGKRDFIRALELYRKGLKQFPKGPLAQYFIQNIEMISSKLGIDQETQEQLVRDEIITGGSTSLRGIPQSQPSTKGHGSEMNKKLTGPPDATTHTRPSTSPAKSSSPEGISSTHLYGTLAVSAFCLFFLFGIAFFKYARGPKGN